ncbi:hypothetical protein [Nonomuraea longicatena]|uniref:Uncharacterized protein n=1 Tax=Nonomuraea longicatena TaxID=83682 RepID=A0ABP3Z9L5_9ACTN
MSARSGRHGHAVVIGAGVAGLATAQVLTDHFEQVTVVERDRLTADARPRPGVPQGRHAHALAARGRILLEDLFPGLGSELQRAGALPADFCRQARHHWPAGVPEPTASPVVIQPVSRPLLELTLREHLAALAEVHVIDGCAVTGLVGRPGEITGVCVTQRKGVGPRREQVDSPSGLVRADLVVDASGRSSHLPGWLTDLGLPAPTELTTDARVGYASRAYHADPSRLPNWRALFETPRAPGRTRGCFALLIEDRRLLITLQGVAGDHPPYDEDGFGAFMTSLDSDLAEVVADLRPASGIHRYARSTTHNRLYHRVRPWPDGLIVLGDATVTFNPLYAQGMTVAAMAAHTLRDLLDRHRDISPRRLTAAYQRRLARATAWPWQMSVLADRAWTEPTLPVRAAVAYLGTCQDLAVEDTAMFVDLARVTNLLARPAVLLRPRHLVQALRHRRARAMPGQYGSAPGTDPRHLPLLQRPAGRQERDHP